MLDITPLSAAVQFGPLEVINLLFGHGGTTGRGQLLHYAVWRNQSDRLDIVEYVIRKGAPVNRLMYHNQPDYYEQRKAFGLGTPLHDAAALGDKDVVGLLLDEGADVSIQDSLGLLPYQRAEANGHWTVMDLLHPANGLVGQRPKI